MVFQRIFKLSKDLKKESLIKFLFLMAQLRYKLIAIFAGIKIYQSISFFTSKDIIVQTAKVFTETHVRENSIY